MLEEFKAEVTIYADHFTDAVKQATDQFEEEHPDRSIRKLQVEEADTEVFAVRIVAHTEGSR